MDDAIASMKVQIELDKKDLRDEVLELLKESQATVSKNELVVKVDGDASELNKLIKQIQAKDPNIKVNLKLGNMAEVSQQVAKEGTKSANAFEQSFDNIDLSNALKKVSDFIDRMDNGFGEVKESIKGIQQSIDNLGSSSGTSKVGKGFDSVGDKIEEAGKKATKTKKQIKDALNAGNGKTSSTSIKSGNLSDTTQQINKNTEAINRNTEAINKNTQAKRENLSVQTNKTPVSSGTNSSDSKVKSSANDSVSSLRSEEKAMEGVADKARDAANAKESFAKANGKVKTSAKASSPALKNESAVLETILPSDKNFDEVLSKLDLTKSKLGEIVKITRQANYNKKEGRFDESYTFTDKNGSKETYALN